MKRFAGYCSLVLVFMVSLSFGEEAAPLPKEAMPLPKEAQELVAKAQAIQSYRARFTLEATEETGEPVQLSGTLEFERPNRRRLELKENKAEGISQLLVSDGSVEWQYYPAGKLAYRLASPPEAPGPHRAFSEMQAGSLRFVEKRGDGAQALSRFEAIPLPSIVEGSPVPIQTLRVDVGEQDGLVREMVLLDSQGDPVLSQRYSNLEVNVLIPAESFSFQPPEGVETVDLGE